ncbi:MAG: glutathione S-transferase N-terminal domain-containing protein [Gammaproteobacteria bacterium]|nr:glutathione S-transferase N-terminal domain-containing protein [Gammaproteobacteria bacterium]
MILKFLRNAIGMLVAFISFLTLPKKKQRSIEEQQVVNAEAEKLKLYQFYGCPFCIKTRRIIYKLDLPIEYRGAQEGSEYRIELQNEGGMVQVPCLRIEKEDGVEWLYESSAIIDYLETKFA